MLGESGKKKKNRKTEKVVENGSLASMDAQKRYITFGQNQATSDEDIGKTKMKSREKVDQVRARPKKKALE